MTYSSRLFPRASRNLQVSISLVQSPMMTVGPIGDSNMDNAPFDSTPRLSQPGRGFPWDKTALVELRFPGCPVEEWRLGHVP
jgi:hypothetical protein